MSYFGTDPGDLTADEMHGRTPDPVPRPSEGDETEIAPLTTVQRSVLAGIARECLEAFAETRRRFPEATLSSEITLAQRCRDILRYEATIRELEARRSPSVPTAIQEQRDAGGADATYWRDKAKHMAALMAMAGATLCEPVSTANIRDAKKSCDIGVHVMREIIEDEKRVASSEEAANSDTERLNWLERQIPTASSGGYRLKSWREAADAPRYYLVGDSAIIEDEHLSLRAAIDAARVQGENSQ